MVHGGTCSGIMESLGSFRIRVSVGIYVCVSSSSGCVTITSAIGGGATFSVSPFRHFGTAHSLGSGDDVFPWLYMLLRILVQDMWSLRDGGFTVCGNGIMGMTWT